MSHGLIMKITLEFDYAHELIDLLKVLSKNLKEDEPTINKEYKFHQEITCDKVVFDSIIKSFIDNL